MEIDRESAVPISRQLRELLLEQIDRGAIEPGERLPTEAELCDRLGISRTTVRKALAALTADGLLVRHPGRGTFLNAAVPSIRPATPRELTIIVPDDRWCWPLQRAASAWNADHPRRPVRLHFRIIGLAHLRSSLILAVAEGAAPDISLIDSAWVAEFAERGYLHALDAIDAPLVAPIAADLVPSLRRQNSLHGELWALPAEADCSVLWFRRDWFAGERLTPPATWDEWVDRALHFRRPTVRARYGLGEYPLAFAAGVAAGETATYQLLPLLWAAGADVIAEGRVVLNSPAAQEAVRFVRDLVHRHRVASPSLVDGSWDGPALAIAAGSVAMALGGTYERALIQAAAGWDDSEIEERLGFVPIPARRDGDQTAVIGGMSYAIYRQCRQPDIALAVLERVLRPAALREFCLRTGQNPPTIAAGQALNADAEPFLHATASVLASARARWPLAEYARVSFQVRQLFHQAIEGDLDLAEAVSRAAAVVSGITGLPDGVDEGLTPTAPSLARGDVAMGRARLSAALATTSTSGTGRGH